MHQWERLPAWACVLLNRVYRDWCCTDTLHPPLCNSPPSETERQSGWATEALSSSASSSPTTVERIHLSPKENVSFHAPLFAARGLSFNLSHLLAAESAEGGGLRAKPTMADKSPWFTQMTQTPSERCLRPSRSTIQKAKRARRLYRARRKTSPHSHCRTSPQRKRGRVNLTPSAAWPLTWLTYSHRPEKHRFIRTVKKNHHVHSAFITADDAVVPLLTASKSEIAIC